MLDGCPAGVGCLTEDCTRALDANCRAPWKKDDSGTTPMRTLCGIQTRTHRSAQSLGDRAVAGQGYTSPFRHRWSARPRRGHALNGPRSN